MTTAALLQATSVVQNTIVSSEFHIAGVPGGFFDATPTSTIVSVFSMAGVGTPVFITENRVIAAAVLGASGISTPVLVGFTVATGPISAALQAAGVSSVILIGADGQIPVTPEAPILVRFTSGPTSGVIPVEIVDSPGPDVVEVQLLDDSRDNYTPIAVDPTNPMRKKIHFAG